MSLIGPAGAHRLDAPPHALLGDRHEPTALGVDGTDQERGVGVAVHAAEIRRDVEIDDVAIVQHPVVGDAVADDLVDRRADALGEAVVVERARVGAPLDARLVDVGVDLVGGDAGGDPLTGQPQDFGRGATRDRACAR